MNLSVVIPLYNNGTTIEDCIQSVLHQTQPVLEIIVVDNRSTDDGPKKVAAVAAKEPRVRLVFEEEQSAAAARNCGSQHVSGEVIAFLDADCEAEPEWSRALQIGLDQPDIAAVGGPIRGAEPENVVEKALAIMTTQDPKPPYLFDRYRFLRGGFPAGNFAVRSRVFFQLNGFNDDFAIGEDHDLCARIFSAGYKILFAPQASAFHHNHSTVRGQFKQAFHYGKAHAKLLREHGSNYWMISIPRRVWEISTPRSYGWLAFDSPAKIITVLLILCLLWKPAAIILLAYLAHILNSTQKMLRHREISVSTLQIISITACRVLRTVAMDLGRLCGAFRYSVICL